MDFCWKPMKKQLHAVGLRQQQVRKEPEDVLAEQDRSLSLDQEEPPQVKEEPEELCSGPEAEQLVLKQSGVEVRWKSEPDEEVELEDTASADLEEPEPPQGKEQLVLEQQTGTFMDTCEDSDLSEPDPDQLLSHVPPVAESTDQKKTEAVDSEPAGRSELSLKRRRPSGSTRGSRDGCPSGCVMCEVCGRSFRNKYKMKVHMRTHTGEKPHACPVCAKTFRDSRDLTVHTRTHTGDKPYVCEVCGRGFVHSGVLAVHLRTHTGDKPYVCRVCGRSFRQSGTLSVHLRTHTGDKPFSCPVCSKGFSRSDNLLVHTRTHAGEARGSAGTGSVGLRRHAAPEPISCETCGRRFTHRSNLSVHLRTHSGDKPYCCARCGKTFRHHSSWSVHMRAHQNHQKL